MATTPGFEPVPGTRHWVELADDGTEWIVVPARPQWLAILFLSAWLTMWFYVGFSRAADLLTGPLARNAFVLVWLALWSAGGLYAASVIAWQLVGRTRLAVSGGALVVRWSMGFLSGTRRYDLDHVEILRSDDDADLTGFGGFFGAGYLAERAPFLPTRRWGGGSIKFDYGAHTRHLLPGLDEAEARVIVDRLAKRMPKRALAVEHR